MGSWYRICMAETVGPQITFQDNEATNDRGITLTLIPGTRRKWPRVEGPSYSNYPQYHTIRPKDDEAGHEAFRDHARKVFGLLDRCIIPNIHQTVYRAATQTPDSLCMSDWHTCGTTHCRAGWVTTLAGEAGTQLEELVGTDTAAALIYHQNGYQIEADRRFCARPNDEALYDMERLADLEARGLAPQEDELLNENLDRR